MDKALDPVIECPLVYPGEAESAKGYAVRAETAAKRAEEVVGGLDSLQGLVNAAAASATASAGSATAASDSETASKNSADAAAGSKTEAENAAERAAESAAAAKQSAEEANTGKKTVADNVKKVSDSAAAALNSENAAAASAKAADQSAQAAAASAQQAAGSAASAQNSVAAAKNSETEAAKSAADAREIKDSLPADYTAMSGDVGKLKNQMQLAYPDNTAPTDATWSARKTLAVLCDEVTASGNPVELEDVCEVEAVASWEPTQEGSGTPSPENIRPIKGRDSVTVERRGENLLNIAAFSLDVDKNNRTKTVKVQQIIPSGKYILKLTHTNPNSGLGMQLFTRDNNKISITGEQIFKLDGILDRIYFNISDTSGNADSIKDIMLITSTATVPTYTPYTGQTNTLTLPETVYGGEVDAVRGEGQETWKIIDLANANISLYGINQHGIANFSLVAALNNIHTTPGRAGYFTSSLPQDNATFNNATNIGIMKANASTFYIRLKETDANNEGAAKAYLASINAKLVYKLAEPVPFTATGAQPIPALAGVNTVLTDADTLSVTAKKAPLVRLGELRKEYEATVDELETAQRDIRFLKKLSKGQVWDFEEKTEDAYVRQVPAGAYAAGVQTWGGKTVSWNQILKNAGFAISDGWNSRYSGHTYSDGVATIKYVGSNSAAWRLEQSIAYTKNHKYFACADIWNDAVDDTSNSGIFCGSGWAIERVKPTANTWIHLSGIVTYTNGTSGFGVYPNRMKDATGRSSQIKNPVLADLTLMFGTGNEPTTTDDPRIAWIEQYAAAHQEYNAGELVSAGVDEVQFNGVAVGVVPSAVQELPGYGWSAGTAKNTVERTADGKWQYVQRVGKVELDGTERLDYYDPIERGLVATIICMPEAMPKVVIGFCSLYKFVKNSVWSGETENCAFFSGDKTLGLSLDLSTATSFGFDGTKDTIPKTVKAMLETYKSRGTPLSITYPLNTPIVTDITDLMGTDALNFEVEPGGSITMHNATELPVPATIQYVEKLSEVISND